MLYPTRNGLIIPPPELGFEVVTPQRRVTSNHHGYFPRHYYDETAVRHVFRNLVDNVYPMMIPDHDELHHQFAAPRPPKDVVMYEIIDEAISLHGAVEVVRESKTAATYLVDSERWERIRRF